MHELSFIEKLLQREVLTRIHEHLMGVNYSPLVIEIDPTTHCNINCPKCVNHSQLNKNEFTHDKLLDILYDLSISGVKNLVFIGGGEPLLYPYIEQTLRYCNNLGFEIGLVTNGVYLRKYTEVISDTVSWVRISVDAATPNTYFRLKGVNYFDNIIEGIIELCHKKTTKVGYSFLLEPTQGIDCNIHELHEAAKLAERIGCDYFEFKPMVDSNHFLYRYSDSLLSMINSFIGLSQSLNISILFPKSINHILKGLSIQKKDYKTCLVSHYRTLLTPDGVFPCPYKRGVLESKLSEIITKQNYWKSQDRLQTIESCIDPSIDCTFYCIRNDLNILLHAIYDLYDNDINLLECFKVYEINDLFI